MSFGQIVYFPVANLNSEFLSPNPNISFEVNNISKLINVSVNRNLFGFKENIFLEFNSKEK